MKLKLGSQIVRLLYRPMEVKEQTYFHVVFKSSLQTSVEDIHDLSFFF